MIGAILRMAFAIGIAIVLTAMPARAADYAPLNCAAAVLLHREDDLRQL